ncbi:MAG: hypothetical protein M3R25_12165 [Bacteroidota bacterium]|nr:hypothetical protein [Bacteroidota bacterium]
MRQKRHFLFGMILLGCSLLPAFGQSSQKDKDEKGDSPLGFGINVGNIRFYNSTFEFGLAPNIAYRFGDAFALGFMLKTDYYYAKYRDPFNNKAYKFSAFDFGPTIFARYKPLWNWDNATSFLQGLFVQAEYERAFLKREAVDSGGGIIVVGDKIQKESFQQNYMYIGIGASSGYPFSTFVSIHYNLLDQYDSIRYPFNYRIGFTYNY